MTVNNWSTGARQAGLRFLATRSVAMGSAVLLGAVGLLAPAGVASAGSASSATKYGLSVFASEGTTTDWPNAGMYLYVQPAQMTWSHSDDLYFGDTGAHAQIDKISASGTFSVVAGNGYVGVPTPGPATSSKLGDPSAVALDPTGNVYVADQTNHEIEKITPTGTLSIFAGTGTMGTPTPGPATSSAMNQPSGIATDSAGNVYVADTDNNVVEKITPTGTLSIFAGDGNIGPVKPGPATSSGIGGPEAVTVDVQGNVYVADLTNHLIEKITPTGTLSIIAGNGNEAPPTPGTATATGMGIPLSIAVDANDNVYVTDAWDSTEEVLKVTSKGILSVIAGNGVRGAPTPGLATSSSFNHPDGVAVDPSGNVYVANVGDESTSGIEKLTPLSAPGAPTDVTASPDNAQASVSFSAPSSPGSSPITSYTVTAIDTTKASRGGQSASGATSPITVNGLTNGDSYTFTVTATSIAGTGTASSPSAPAVPSTVPGAPTSVTSAPQYKGAIVSWKAPTTNGGTHVTGYKVFEGTTSIGESTTPVATTNSSTTSATITGLNAWSTYYFTVEAINANGVSVASHEVSTAAAANHLAGPNTTLAINQVLFSANNAYFLTLQTDGNLVVYNAATNAPLFESKTYHAIKGSLLTLGSNGKLTLTTTTSTLAWAPKAKAGVATQLVLENNGSLELLTRSGSVLWTGTAANSGG